MNFWKCNNQPDKFCVTTGAIAMMITHKHDEIKIINRRLDAGYAANIKARYKPDSIEDYPILKGLIHLLNKKS
jgi:hypothetical protein